MPLLALQINIMGVLFCIVTLCWLSFIYPCDQLENRLSTNMTLVLTSVAFKFTLSSFVPPVSFLTALDKYVLLNFFYLLGVIVENGVTAMMHRGGQDELAETVDLYASLTLVIGWIPCNVLYVVWLMGEMNPEESWLSCSCCRTDDEMLSDDQSAMLANLAGESAIYKARLERYGEGASEVHEVLHHQQLNEADLHKIREQRHDQGQVAHARQSLGRE